MAKSKPNLSVAVEDITPSPAPTSVTSERHRRPRRNMVEAGSPTVLVGANLEPRYARNLAMLHAETGKSKKELLQKALDMLFTSMSGPRLKL